MSGRRELEEQTSEPMQVSFWHHARGGAYMCMQTRGQPYSGTAARSCALLQGEIPALSELPSPWGPKAYEPTEGDKMLGPAKFPTAFNPLSDTPMVA